MPEQSIRFGISDGEGKRSATWKCWAPRKTGKNDIYLACRALGGFLKTSLHESGQWHTAFSRKFHESQISESNYNKKERFVETWPRPVELSPGFTLAFRIVTPWSAVKTSYDHANFKKIFWIPNASTTKATEIDIIITSPNKTVTGWPAMRSMGTQLVGSMKLDSGETVWIVHWEIEIPKFPVEKSTFHYFKGKSRDDIRGRDMRILAQGVEPDGSRVLYDCALELSDNDN